MQRHLNKRYRGCSCLFNINFEHVFAYFAIPPLHSCLVLLNNTFIRTGVTEIALQDTYSWLEGFFGQIKLEIDKLSLFTPMANFYTS